MKNVERNSIYLLILLFFSFIIHLAVTPKQKKAMHAAVEPKEKYIIKIDSTFSKEALIEYVYSLNLRFPHIVLAQAQLESGNFSSKIFRENNNLFGMKEAKIRPTTNCGTNRGHAKYNHWRESVIDYVLYYAVYLHRFKTEESYYNYLDRGYAKNSNYSKILRKIAASYKKL
jgi:uncharacterized FlgJ-related protein